MTPWAIWPQLWKKCRPSTLLHRVVLRAVVRPVALGAHFPAGPLPLGLLLWLSRARGHGSRLAPAPPLLLPLLEGLPWASAALDWEDREAAVGALAEAVWGGLPEGRLSGGWEEAERGWGAGAGQSLAAGRGWLDPAPRPESRVDALW